MELTLKETLIWLMTKGVSYQQLWKYLRQFIKNEYSKDFYDLGDIQQVHQSINFTGSKRKPNIDFYMTSMEFETVKKYALQSFMIGESVYPESWMHLPQPPIVVFYSGDLSLLQFPSVSIIGTRNVSDYGKRVTHELSQVLIEQGISLVSGLAKGIDQIAHQTAVTEGGKTIGIIASGLNYSYPRENMPLQSEMMANQLVLSEYLPDAKIKKHHFVMRNRLVAGLTPVTIVIEAAIGSGSLITANYAIQFNKELLVVPGRITDSQAEGGNELIYNGATPIISVPQAVGEIYQILQAHRVKK